MSMKINSKRYYHGAVVAMLVYDITNYETFKSLPLWLEEIRKHANENIVITLVGNKLDLADDRAVTVAEAREFSGKLKNF
jgi:Ras-related protein Rab-2A